MKIMALGSFVEDESLEEFRGRPLIVIAATPEEIRGLKVSVYDEVELVKAAHYLETMTDEERSRLTEGSGAAMARHLGEAIVGTHIPPGWPGSPTSSPAKPEGSP